ncbi:hypothetical protein ACFX2C_047386 [Malus domestica]
MEDEVDRREMRKWNCTCDSCPTSTTANTTSADSTTIDSDTTTSTTSSFLEYPLRTGKFFSSEELEQLKRLEDYKYYQELEFGSMWVRMMRPEKSPSVCSPSSSWSRCFCLLDAMMSIRFHVMEEIQGIFPTSLSRVTHERGIQERGS